MEGASQKIGSEVSLGKKSRTGGILRKISKGRRANLA